jgi:hypothetical protein
MNSGMHFAQTTVTHAEANDRRCAENAFIMKGAVLKMDCNCQANHSIKCHVDQCKNHCSSEDYCSLNCITVGTHEANPTMDQCTDCQSFMAK